MSSTGAIGRDNAARNVTDLYVIGAGGLAKEMAWLVQSCDSGFCVAGFADYEPSGESLIGLPVVSDELLLSTREGLSVLLGVGFPQLRLDLAARYDAHLAEFPSFLHTSAIQLGPCEFGRGVVISPGCVLTGDLTIGDFTLLNLNVTIGHDVSIGSGCVLNPGSRISGSVSIGNGVLVGTGATILQGIQIGDGATIGAGSVVTKDVPDHAVVAAVMARATRIPAHKASKSAR